MYNLIIGYNNSSINLIKSLICKEKIVFLIDDKSPEEIKIKNKFLYYYQVNITDMKQILDKSSKAMLSHVFIITEDDYLNLMIEDNLKFLENVQVVYNFRALEKISNSGNKNLYLQDFFEPLGKEVI
ncbi:MAG TPA: hypothetical protein DCW51_04565 [Clostridium sp.]|nr:hypothetical protein [Clostridium sp.]